MYFVFKLAKVLIYVLYRFQCKRSVFQILRLYVACSEKDQQMVRSGIPVLLHLVLVQNSLLISLLLLS